MPTPVFLERRSYRLRRMMDAVRFLPVLGILLWMVPLLWPVAADEAAAEGTTMSGALWYIFAIWIGLIAASFGLWRRTRTAPPPDVPD